MKTASVFLISLFIISCSGKKSADQAQESQPATEEATKTSACIWDNVPVWETASEKGKYLTAISIGEIVTVLDEVPADSTAAKTFIKIKLGDGTEGWARKDFIVSGGKSVVFINDSDIYGRPDALTKTDKKFSKYDIVGIVNSKDDFFEVKGKRAEGKWMETGWVKNNNISDDRINIATAKFIKKALVETDKAKKMKALQDIVSNPDLSSSALMSEVRKIIGDMDDSAVDTTSTGNN